jgi:hypothetical protein
MFTKIEQVFLSKGISLGDITGELAITFASTTLPSPDDKVVSLNRVTVLPGYPLVALGPDGAVMSGLTGVTSRKSRSAIMRRIQQKNLIIHFEHDQRALPRSRELEQKV